MSDARDMGVAGGLRREDLGVSRKCPTWGRFWSIPKAESELQSAATSWRTERCRDALQGVGGGGGQHLCAEATFQECVEVWGDAGCQGPCQEFWVQVSCPGNLEGMLGSFVC